MLSIYDSTLLNKVDKIKMIKIKHEYNKYPWRVSRLHQEAEKIRRKYKYSGGSWGDSYIPLY